MPPKCGPKILLVTVVLPLNECHGGNLIGGFEEERQVKEAGQGNQGILFLFLSLQHQRSVIFTYIVRRVVSALTAAVAVTLTGDA